VYSEYSEGRRGEDWGGGGHGGDAADDVVIGTTRKLLSAQEMLMY
jgi:hypothetical protein